jgi:hypothetical protein
MNPADQSLCPIPGIGHCLYDRCPYWDAARQECDAPCLEIRDSGEPDTSGGSCLIPWTEDFD